MISYMIKRLSLYIIACFALANAYSQNTVYYKLTNIHDNKSSLKIQGGQFITFIGDICYESDSKGIGVGHGTLTYNPSYSTNSVQRYMGASYWGKDAVYAFNADKSVLNVVLENGMVLVYKRSTPPNGVYTCSLIRPSQEKSGGNGDPYNPINPMPQPSPNPAPTPNPEPGPIPTEKTGGLTEIQYRHAYQGYEDIVKRILETFQICGSDMPYTARLQGIQTMKSAQKDMIRVRQEAASYGIIIPQSSYETVSP